MSNDVKKRYLTVDDLNELVSVGLLSKSNAVKMYIYWRIKNSNEFYESARSIAKKFNISEQEIYNITSRCPSISRYGKSGNKKRIWTFNYTKCVVTDEDLTTNFDRSNYTKCVVTDEDLTTHFDRSNYTNCVAITTHFDRSNYTNCVATTTQNVELTDQNIEQSAKNEPKTKMLKDKLKDKYLKDDVCNTENIEILDTTDITYTYIDIEDEIFNSIFRKKQIKTQTQTSISEDGAVDHKEAKPKERCAEANAEVQCDGVDNSIAGFSKEDEIFNSIFNNK